MPACPFCATTVPDGALTCPSCGASLSGLQLEAGTLLLGKYRLESVLGQGGFGISYLAQDLTLNRRTAIKELFPEGCTRQGNTLVPAPSLGAQGFAETKQRFLEEARTLAQFNHPHIVRVFEVFEANNTAYIVMEALEGETLGAVIARSRSIPQVFVERIGLDVCEALEVVHGAGLLHRDIKPDNLFISKDNRVVLIDFGSARGFKPGTAMHHTRLVTPGYAAPEQYATEARFGTYTDIYGLSATLYYAATGKLPPTSSDRIISSDTELHVPASITEPLRSALTRGLALRIDARPQTAKEFAALLETAKLPNSIPSPVQKPSISHEEVLYRNDGILVTTKYIEITSSLSNQSYTKKYEVKDISDVFSTNDGGIAFSNILSPLFFAVSAICFGLLTLLIALLTANLSLLTLLFLVGMLAMWSFFGYSERRRRDIYYVIAITKSGESYSMLLDKDRLRLYTGPDGSFANQLAQRLNACLEP